MIYMKWNGIHMKLLGYHFAFAWLGFLVPCIVAALYLLWRRDGLTRWHWALWLVGTVATYYFTLRITPRGIKMMPLYVVGLIAFYVIPAWWRREAPRVAAGTIGALVFFSMALIDLAAAINNTPPNHHTVLGGGGTNDMLFRSPLQVAILWACALAILQTTVKCPKSPGMQLLRFHFSLRPVARSSYCGCSSVGRAQPSQG